MASKKKSRKIDKPKSSAVKKVLEIPKGLRAESLKDWEIVSYTDYVDGETTKTELYVVLPSKYGAFKYVLNITNKDKISVEMLHCNTSWQYKIERLPRPA